MLLLILLCFVCQWQWEYPKIEVVGNKSIKTLRIKREIPGYSSKVHGGIRPQYLWW